MEPLAIQIGQAIREWLDDKLPRKYRKAKRGDPEARKWIEDRATNGDKKAARALEDLMNGDIEK